MFLAILFYVGLFAFLAVAFFGPREQKGTASPAITHVANPAKILLEIRSGFGDFRRLSRFGGRGRFGMGRRHEYGRGNDLFPPKYSSRTSWSATSTSHVPLRGATVLWRRSSHRKPRRTLHRRCRFISSRRTLCEPNGRASLRPSQVTDCAIAECGPAASRPPKCPGQAHQSETGRQSMPHSARNTALQDRKHSVPIRVRGRRLSASGVPSYTGNS